MLYSLGEPIGVGNLSLPAPEAQIVDGFVDVSGLFLSRFAHIPIELGLRAISRRRQFGQAIRRQETLIRHRRHHGCRLHFDLLTASHIADFDSLLQFMLEPHTGFGLEFLDCHEPVLLLGQEAPLSSNLAFELLLLCQ